MSVEELRQEVAKLQAIVEKQSSLLAKTGQQVMDMQVKDVKSKMNAAPAATSDKLSNIDLDDYVTNEDIVQLVGELQSQLDYLEERSIRRTFNIQLDVKNMEGKIAPLSNKDGEYPDANKFPATIKEFIEIDNASLVLLCEFYEIIVMNNDVASQLDQGKSLQEINSNAATMSLEDRMKQFSSEQLDELKDELARYLGLRIRIGNGNSW